MRQTIVAVMLTFLVPWSARAQAPDAGAVGTLALADSQDVSLAPPPIPVQGTDPDFPRGRISGYMFGDAYYNVSGDPAHHYSAAGADSDKVNIDGSPLIGKDLNGIQLRRIYFQLDNDLSIKFSTRLRLEMDGKELTSGGKIGVYVKAAYLQAKNVIPRGNFFFGEITTPTFENSEEFWQYRSVEKTIVDFRGISPSADLGVELKGFADAGHKIGYSAMVGNGPGQKPETNRYKRYYLSLPLNLIKDFKLEPYVDYEPGVAGADKALYKLFAGYELKRGAIGAEIVDQVVHSSTGPNTEPFGLSVFARMAPSPTLGAYARFDRWQPNTRAANRVDSDIYIAGLDWQPYKDVHVMPNVESAQYRARGTAVAPAHHDTQARLTFYYRFSKP
ncbi:MAG TPA: hypothetical protein VK527_03745, partial [Candidatus Limnocylindrales bacterium]|nr:hypothetical protein [Candidatus Limnocylindrales bacterium]